MSAPIRTLASWTLAAAVLAAPLFAAAPARAADTFEIDPVHSDVTFEIRHLVSRVGGQFGEFDGTISMDPEDPSSSSVEFRIDAASIDTRNERRDGHLRSEDFFWVEEHPEISFRSTGIEKTGESTYDVQGILTMRGVSKEITLPVELFGVMQDPWGNQRAGFGTETVLDRKDFGIEWNQALDQGGVVLGDDVTVRIRLEAVQAQEGDAPAGAGE